MRAAVAALLTGLFVALLAPPASADSRFYIDLPVRFQFSGNIDGGSDSISGIILAWGFENHIGVGLESYTATADDTAKGIKTDVSYTFLDVFVFFDALSLKWQVGLGIGSAEVDGFTLTDGSGTTIGPGDGDATQFFFTAGIPLGDTTSVTLGYRAVSAEVDDIPINNAPSGQAFDLGGALLSLGLQFAF